MAGTEQKRKRLERIAMACARTVLGTQFEVVDAAAKCAAPSARAIIASPAQGKGEQVSPNRSDMSQILFPEQLVGSALGFGGSRLLDRAWVALSAGLTSCF
jgi:hypothetical protein